MTAWPAPTLPWPSRPARPSATSPHPWAASFVKLGPRIIKEAVRLLKCGEGGPSIRLVLTGGGVGPPSSGGSVNSLVSLGRVGLGALGPCTIQLPAGDRQICVQRLEAGRQGNWVPALPSLRCVTWERLLHLSGLSSPLKQRQASPL